jgi:hypothetical protein
MSDNNQNPKDYSGGIKINAKYDQVMRLAYRGLHGCAQDKREEIDFLRKIGRLSQVAYDDAIREIELDEKDARLLREAIDLAELINMDIADDEDIRRWKELEPEITAMIDLTK